MGLIKHHVLIGRPHSDLTRSLEAAAEKLDNKKEPPQGLPTHWDSSHHRLHLPLYGLTPRRGAFHVPSGDSRTGSIPVRDTNIHPPIMATTITVVCLFVVLILLPIHILMWATESKHTRINRLRSNGSTWKQIADRYGCSPSTCRRWAIAA